MIFAIDATHQLHVDWHGSSGRADLASSFAARLKLLQAQHPAARLMCAFDVDGPTWRHELEPAYKANRPPKPEGLVAGIEAAIERCQCDGVPVLMAEGFEADDCVATVAAAAVRGGEQVVIVSADKDCKQLLQAGKVSILKGMSSASYVTADMLRAEYGFGPPAWVDYQALVGDLADNVVGCPGIGRKTAAAILKQCGSLDAALKNPFSAPVKGKQRENLIAFSARADHVRRLLTLRTDVAHVTDALL